MAPMYRPRVTNGPLIKPREPQRAREIGRLMALAALLVLPGLLYAGLQAQLHRYRRAVIELERQLTALEEQRLRLELERATLRDPRRIEEQARARMGLAPLSQDQVVYLTRLPSTPGAPPPYVAGLPGDDHGHPRP